MTRDKVVQLVKRRLGFRTDLDSDILLEMEMAQHDLTYNTLPIPWFLKITFPGMFNPGPEPWNEGMFLLPSGFISFVYPDCSMSYLSGYPGVTDTPFLLRSMPWPQMRDELLPQKVPKGRPQRYAQKDALYMQLWPTPDQVYWVEFNIYSGDELIENLGPDNLTQQNKWTDLQPELLAVSTALRIAPSLRDSELTAYLQQEEARLLARLEKATIQREEQGFDRIINESLLTDMAPEGAYP